MSFEFPTVTALGVVSTGCVESSSEILNELPPELLPRPLELFWFCRNLSPVAPRCCCCCCCCADWRPGARHLLLRRPLCARFGQCLHQHWQNVTGRNVFQIACDRFRKLNVRIKLVDQLTDERHVDRPRHNVNAVGAHVGSNLNFPDDHRFFGQNAAASPRRTPAAALLRASSPREHPADRLAFQCPFRKSPSACRPLCWHQRARA